MNRNLIIKSLAVIISIVGILVIVSWIFDIQILLQPVPESAAMAFITSYALFVSGLALFLFNQKNKFKNLYESCADQIQKKTRALQQVLENSKEQNLYLEKIKLAMLNLLEDLEKEKKQVTSERDKINTILGSIGDGVFVVDKDLKIIIFNEIAAQLSGWSVPSVIGQKYTDILKFVYEKDGKINDGFIKEAMSTGNIEQMSNHTLLVKKNGDRIAVADRASPVKNINGEIVGCVVVFRDVTKEREIDKAKREFVSLSSHQLRTPLSTIGWYAELLLSGDAGKLNKSQKKYINEIYHGNQRMVDLVNSLLDVSRLELGTFAINLEPINWKDAVKIVATDLAPVIETKSIIFKESYDGDLNVRFDHRMANIILQNLLSNAIKYTPAKGRVSISIKRDNQKTLIAIEDSGYGIPKAVQNRIFTKLFRADNVREKESDGTGLGLYIAKSIIDQSGGRIWFESEEGKGTSFYVEIPVEIKVDKKAQTNV